MMRHYFLFLILLLFVFGSVSSLADTTPSKTPMNEASVAVMDQSSTALQLGLQAAFSEVMMKMSGNAKIMD
ncbi:MAG TPA: hypothetical protein VI844_03480, partial [Coxiellaceae bacterium]|nr:hypothetical protein [Coxiellaceae bacterium]